MSWYIHTHLCGFVIDTGNSRAVGLFGPLSLQIGSNDGIQRKSSADGGFRWASRGPVSFENRNKTQWACQGYVSFNSVLVLQKLF